MTNTTAISNSVKPVGGEGALGVLHGDTQQVYAGLLASKIDAPVKLLAAATGVEGSQVRTFQIVAGVALSVAVSRT